MALKIMADNNEIITVARDGAMYNVFASNKNFVIKDIGQELAITYSSSSYVVELGTGECLICGRHVYNDGALSLTLDANDSGYIVLRYDLSQVGANLCQLLAVNSTYSENLNNTGTINDIILAEYTTDGSGVATFVDVRDIKESVANYTAGTGIEIDDGVIGLKGIAGIDANNLLATITSVDTIKTYTATEDCICYIRITSGAANYSKIIDWQGVSINEQIEKTSAIWYLRKGESISFRSTYGTVTVTCSVYGIEY